MTRSLGPAVPVAVTLPFARDGLGLQAAVTLGVILVVFAVIAVAGLVRYATTRYRVTAERVELRSGLVFRRRRSIARDRVRSVDLTADPLQRFFGLATVVIGTGRTDDEKGLVLDGVSRAGARLLRVELLGRTAPADAVVAELRPAWIGYALLSSWSLLIGLAPFGVFFRVLDIVGIDPAEVGFLGDLWSRVTAADPVVVAAVAVGIVLSIGLAGALLLYVESWWDFRLTREPDRAFSVRRGLLTTRSMALEERRLYGVELAEPLPLRWGGGARLKAVATGLKEDESVVLLPPAPRAEAHRVAAAVLAVGPSAGPSVGPSAGPSVGPSAGPSVGPSAEASPTLAPLAAHPRAALRRRIVRALWPSAVVSAVLGGLAVWLSWVPGLLWLAGPALLPAALLLALDAYRNLGHGLHGPYLVTRYGTARRRTVALRRTAIIGWTVSRSPFQRRSGLVTLAATTAAGSGSYKVRDVSVAEGLAFAEESVPGLLTPFVH
ncbi:PH domain-containing protein [Planomonospora sp. ID82291]|nr:PH domain-containing protein [Planomonospora sp. ID82291]